MLEVTIVMTPIKAVVKNTRYFTAFYDLNKFNVTDKMDSNKPSFGSVTYKQNVTLSNAAKDHFRTTLPVQHSKKLKTWYKYSLWKMFRYYRPSNLHP